MPKDTPTPVLTSPRADGKYANGNTSPPGKVTPDVDYMSRHPEWIDEYAVPRTKSVLGHIFRESEGHVNPTSIASQERYISLFEKVANTPGNLNPNVLTDYQRAAMGFKGFSQTFRNGTQVWTQTLRGKIINAGVNLIPK